MRMSPAERLNAPTQASVALLRILRTETSQPAANVNAGKFEFKLAICLADNEVFEFLGHGDLLEDAIAQAISRLCVQPFRMKHIQTHLQQDGQYQCVVAIEEKLQDPTKSTRSGVGRNVAESIETGLAVATLRAVKQQGLETSTNGRSKDYEAFQ